MSADTNLLKALRAIQEADAALVTQDPKISEAVAQLRRARQALLAEMDERLAPPTGWDPIPEPTDLPNNTMVLPKCIADAIRREVEK